MAATCSVLRCGKPSKDAVNIARGLEQGLLEALVCAEHKYWIEDGQAWVCVELADSDIAILMADDLPPVLTDYRSTRGHTSSKGYVSMLRLDFQRGDGSTGFTDYELTDEFKEVLRNIL